MARPLLCWVVYLLCYGAAPHRLFVSSLRIHSSILTRQVFNIDKLDASFVLMASKSKDDAPPSKVTKPRRRVAPEPTPILTPSLSESTTETVDFVETTKETKTRAGLITQGDAARLILGQRVAYPGDYVVHEQYGIGQYIGIRLVNLTPYRDVATMQPAVVVRYSDCEAQWFQRVADRELLFFRAFDGLYSPFATGEELDTSVDEEDKAAFSAASLGAAREQELSGVMDTKKWKKRLRRAQLVSQRSAVNLVRIMTIRNNIHRTPAQVSTKSQEFIAFQESFKFEPTVDQREAFAAIQYEMTRSTRPMDKLVCGDVGFGKTEVAMRAMYTAVLSGKQVVLMAPTRTLAYQHLSTLSERMPGVTVMLLRGGGKADAVRVREAVKSGECQIVVGTHAVIQKSVEFRRLGLVVIDEEQRFGVDHKERLKMVASGIDVLTLSATPIPRTLYMSLSNMRSLNLLKTPPQGRKEVHTTVGLWNDALAQQAIQQELGRGGQVFVIVPYIKDSEEMVARIKRLVKNVRCMEANGRHEDLELRIDAFRRKQADVLVATTVIENGIDMPNVNTIIVSSAERFGMAALHQLRGRVGRSSAQAYALFLTNHTHLTPQAENRLMYLKRFTALGSGYELSMRDMEARGTGSIFGEEQSGNCEVGVELQVRIMARAVEALSLDHVMSVAETRVALHGALETFAQKLKRPLPAPKAGLDAVSVWEDEVSALVILHSFRDLVQDPVEVKRHIASFQAAQSAEALEELETQWKEVLNKKVSLVILLSFEWRLQVFNFCRVWHRNFHLCSRSCWRGLRCVNGSAAWAPPRSPVCPPR